ncbi:ECF transporter S component [Selenihalanaerobacter shriftii]|uniref:Uncharacterized membrane protein n=1 Tax=Selenihalanaerobacter shriftii TaxID=142842 RepID=A0A1T4JW66_9FIRM|nr:ECF transporter S component [Selenihalanaerobacter shriftii]SJZ34369.1 Uncharacterized membrane protein [Selenihalanaerobacter shriftii]
MKVETRTITIVGTLSAISIVLGQTPLGLVPTPLGVAATTMHIPVIIGAIVEGPLVGSLVGLIFGLSSFLRQASPFVADPLVAIIPRVLIGILAGYSYKLFSTKESIAIGIAAAIGTLTNTIGVLGLAAWRGLLPMAQAKVIALGHGLPEIIVAILITLLVVKSLKHVK